MNPWWWVPIGLAAWFLVAIVVSLLIGPVLRRSSQARATFSQEPEETSDESKPPQDERQASLLRRQPCHGDNGTRRRPGQ